MGLQAMRALTALIVALSSETAASVLRYVSLALPSDPLLHSGSGRPIDKGPKVGS